jgi:aryl-alcohol dehydrogenase-like predicted oxidoreductase
MTQRITLPKTELTVHPLCLGGNVFGWSANEEESFAVLDAYVAAGGNFIDTADMYSEWKPGNVGGESERIIGNWMKSRGNRSEMVIATKVAKLSTRAGLSAANIRAAAEDSLSRLQTDYIDLYYAHEDDTTIPLTQSLEAFNALVVDGKVRYIAASNYSAARLREAIHLSQTYDWAPFIGLQNQYNLLDRSEFESGVGPALAALGISALPYYGLARGFLSGKYSAGATVDSVRAGGVADYQNDRGYAAIAQLTELSKKYEAPISAIALAWLRGQSVVSTPIASARTVEQLKEIVQIVDLSSADLESLSAITA